MNAFKSIGIVLLVLSVPLLLGAIILLFSTSAMVPAFVQDDKELTGYTLAGVGAFFLVAGILLTVIGPRRARARGAVLKQGHGHAVEIKRTEMNWGASQPAPTSSGEALQESLDDVNRKMGQLKVQYGMGQVSSESYKVLMAQYEKEKTAIELQIIQRTG